MSFSLSEYTKNGQFRVFPRQTANSAVRRENPRAVEYCSWPWLWLAGACSLPIVWTTPWLLWTLLWRRRRYCHCLSMSRWTIHVASTSTNKLADFSSPRETADAFWCSATSAIFEHFSEHCSRHFRWSLTVTFACVLLTPYHVGSQIYTCLCKMCYRKQNRAMPQSVWTSS